MYVYIDLLFLLRYYLFNRKTIFLSSIEKMKNNKKKKEGENPVQIIQCEIKTTGPSAFYVLVILHFLMLLILLKKQLFKIIFQIHNFTNKKFEFFCHFLSQKIRKFLMTILELLFKCKKLLVSFQSKKFDEYSKNREVKFKSALRRHFLTHFTKKHLFLSHPES